MTDIISAQCTVFTFISILFSLWYKDVEDVLAIKLTSSENDDCKRKKIKSVLSFKIIPLLCLSFFNCLIFSSSAIKAFHFIKFLIDSNIQYNPIEATVAFVWVISLLYVILNSFFLIKTIKKLHVK